MGFGTSAPPPAPPLPQEPSPVSPAAKKAEADRRIDLARRRGFSTTIATSPQGLGGAPNSKLGGM